MAERHLGSKRTENYLSVCASLSILINVQLGNYDTAINQTDFCCKIPTFRASCRIRGRPSYTRWRTASRFGTSRESNLIPMPPRLRDLQRLARTELADVRRVIRIRTVMQPEDGFQKIGPILRQRPNHPFIQAMGADLEYKVGKVEEAKKRLDRVRRKEISDASSGLSMQ